MSVIKEFREFISRGSVVDMAVGVVIGGAFNSIVTAFTGCILTPLISCITGKVNISSLSLVISEELKIPYGEFLQSVINFLLTAAVLFLFIKLINSIRRGMEKLEGSNQEEEQEEETKPTTEELLGEILEIMKKDE